ncbi:cytochrome c oxidase subunit 4 isoform 1, mitochondrial-like [Athalia rosae]|uniref:cytochrome c oxidase subunit 4 isoform 1, mitochondrial-like n=1 Tax=Athalia rosae TaxID=37344 RepID=UPI0020336172|nr:cytochrome c oxidase subunit 4 isoform 1, mitochondrial-like [Athalia rosae]
MVGRVLSTRLLRIGQIQNVANMSTGHFSWDEVNKIGDREVVCHGLNGNANYFDRPDYPMPAIRFKENTSDVQALREKEKGDWKKLSIEEKKALYRASFCQTFAEMNAPTGEWKGVVGWGFFGVTLAIWIYIYMRKFILPPLPITFDEEHQLAQLDRMLKLDINPIEGISARARK